MNFILKIEGVEHKSQIIKIDLSKQNFVETTQFFRIDILGGDFAPKEVDIQKYDGKEVFGEYIGKSRIDGFPMFKIDTFQIDRDKKISKVLN